MHPLDEFAAFQALVTQGHAAADIAHRFGVTAKVVEQRLRLAQVHPDILDAYRSEEISLEIVMAFASSEDQGRQKAVWADMRERYISVNSVRNALYSEGCSGEYHLALYVGEDAYRTAGGQITVDLFSEAEGNTIWEDAALVKKLALEKIQETAEALQKKEGWGWSHASLNRDWAFIHQLDRLPALEGQDEAFDPQHHSHAGICLYVNHEGELACERGLVRPEDQPKDTANTSKDEEGEKQAEVRYSQSLMEDLGRQRLALTQQGIAQNYKMAFDLMLLSMLGGLTYKGHHYHTTYHGDPTLSMEDRAALGLERDLAGLGIDLSFLDLKTPDALSWLAKMAAHEKQRLFAACVAQHVQGGLGCEVLGYIGAELQIDVAAQWRPDLSVFKRLRKDAAFAIAGDVLGPEWVAQNSTLKKGELAAVLADIFAGKQLGTLSAETIERATRWLPEGMGFDWEAENTAVPDDEDLPSAFQIVA